MISLLLAVLRLTLVCFSLCERRVHVTVDDCEIKCDGCTVLVANETLEDSMLLGSQRRVIVQPLAWPDKPIDTLTVGVWFKIDDLVREPRKPSRRHTHQHTHTHSNALCVENLGYV